MFCQSLSTHSFGQIFIQIMNFTYKFFSQKFSFFLCISYVLLSLTSCEDESDVYNIGSEWTDSYLQSYQIDTLTVKTYTIQLDSTITSGQSAMLVGRHNDAIFGKIKAKTFIQINPQALSIDNDAIYDSAALLLRYDNYYYGDTLSPLSLNLHTLNSRIRMNPETGYLYNTSQINFYESSIGSATFNPRPNTDNAYVRIKAPNLGKDLFEYLQHEDVVDQESFLTYFRGLAIDSDESSHSVMRFSMSATDSITTNSGELIINPVFRIYYHYESEDGNIPEAENFDFTLDTAFQFNQISTDFTGTPLEGLSPQNPLPSESTGNMSYLQSGLGIFTRIEIPYVKSLYGINGNLKLMSAQMYLRPINNSYQHPYYLPTALNYYQGNRQDDLIGSFTNDSGEEQAIESYINNEFQEDNYFLVPLTSFIQSELESDIDNDYTLLIYPTNYPAQSLERVVFGNKNHAANKLELNVNILTY